MKTEARTPGPANPGREKLNAPGVAPTGPAPALAVRTARDVAAEEVAWLWPGNLALGKVAVLAGAAGAGKTLLAAGDFAARVSAGFDWPDGSPCPRGDVLIASGEDSPADTLVPRLAEHGADLDRVHFVEGPGCEVAGCSGRAGGCVVRTADPVGGLPGGSAGWAFTPADLPALEREMRRRDAVRLVVIDPVSAFLGDGGRAARALLADLAAMAARRSAAVLLVAALHREPAAGAVRAAPGPAALVAAARPAWLLTRDGGDRDRRLLWPVKNNLGPDRYGYAWRLEGRRVAWEPGRLDLGGDEAEAAAGVPRRPGPREAQAASFLADLLKDGPRAWGVVARDAKKAGLAPGTLVRARDSVAETYKVAGRRGRWFWRLRGDRRVEPVENPFEDMEERLDEQCGYR